MNKRGEIREIPVGGELKPGEIDVTYYARDLSRMGQRARRDYHRAIRQGLNPEAALACAQETDRNQIEKGRAD